MPRKKFTRWQDELIIIAADLSKIEDLETRLQCIAEHAAAATGSEGSSILLYEKETEQLYFAAAKTRHPYQLRQLRVPLDESIAGWVYTQSQPLSIPNAQFDPLIYQKVGASVGLTTRNLLAIPITYADQTLGVLEVINKSGDLGYSPADQAVLETLASFSATAIKLHNLENESEHLFQDRTLLDKQMSDFIAITSHELRTPLGLVLGHATYLREIITEEVYQNQLEVIIRNAERLKEIIESLNQVANFETGTVRIRWEHINLNTLLETVINSLSDHAEEKQISIVAKLPDDLIQLFCDPAKLSVAISNILRNALIYSDDGQDVVVSLEKVTGYAQICITDYGIGIPINDLHRIFDRFYQVEPHLTRRHGGMGLGLSVTKSIVESHAGQVWVESELGKGSTFIVLLPTDPH